MTLRDIDNDIRVSPAASIFRVQYSQAHKFNNKFAYNIFPNVYNIYLLNLLSYACLFKDKDTNPLKLFSGLLIEF